MVVRVQDIPRERDVLEVGSTRDMNEEQADVNRRRKHFFDRYEWWFVLLGLFGNFLFFVGSILFLREATQTQGVWLFIIGSCLMLISSSAASLAEYARSKLR